MKKQKFSGYSLAIAVAILLSSCGTSRIADFSSRKYTDFERGSVSGFSPTWGPGGREENKKELYANAETKYTNFNYEDLKTSDYYGTVLTRTVENDPPVIRKELKGLLRAYNAKVHVKRTDLPGNSILAPRPPNGGELKSPFGDLGAKRMQSVIRQIDPEPEFLIELIFAILLPPVAVYLHTDEIGTLFWISLLLTLFFWIPGIIFAVLVVGDLIK